MRSITPALLAVSLCVPFAMAASPTQAEAAPVKLTKRSKTRAATGPKKPAKPKGPKGGGKAGKSVLNGAGQRLHFSFGGRITHDAVKNKLKGKFRIIVHPLSPPGSVVNTICRYRSFNNPVREGRTLTFDAHGSCTSLRLDGSLSRVTASNRITIVDSVSGTDSIDVEAIGGSGIAIPGGELSHGSFTFVSATDGDQ